MKVLYKINKNIVNREAAALNFALNQLKSSIHIEKNGSKFNGKSLLNLLVGDIKSGDTIEITFDNIEEQSRLLEIFNKFGTQLKFQQEER